MSAFKLVGQRVGGTKGLVMTHVWMPSPSGV